ncbi:MAG: four helix bundle protein [Ignavibacteria bacterium]|nr:four helix bundle protein [Ignavibacteria bacterium]
MTASNTSQIFKKRLYSSTLNLIKMLDRLNQKDVVSYRLGDQLLRSGTSVIANYVEASSSSSKAEFAKYLNISLRSSNESKLWLCLLRDSERLKNTEVKPLIENFDKYSKIFASSLITIRKKKAIENSKKKINS